MKPRRNAFFPRGPEGRALRAGGYSVLSSVAVICIAAALLWIVDALPVRMTKLDASGDGLYSLSEQTRQVAASLTEDATVSLVAQPGNEDGMLTALIARYADQSAHIHAEVVDPAASPQFLSEHTSGSLTENSIVVASGGRSRFIPYDDLYRPDYDVTYEDGTFATVFYGEAELTSALDYVSGGKTPTAYRLGGHGEAEISDTLASMIERENVTLKLLSLLAKPTVPEDCACLIVFAPQSDLSATERDAILTYLEGGGNLLAVLDASAGKLPNFSAVLAYYGISRTDGVVVEGDDSYYLSGYPLYILSDFRRHAITEPLTAAGYYALSPAATGLTIEENGDVSASALLTTTNQAYSKVAGTNMTTYDREEGDVGGPFVLTAAAEKALGGEETARLVCFGSVMMFDDDVNELVSGANDELFVNALDWMSAREERISIRAKKLNSGVLTVPTGDAAAWSAALIVAVPLCCVLAGVAVTVRRKRR